MSLKPFTIQSSGLLKRIQDTINSGIALYQTQLLLGGHSIEMSRSDYQDSMMIARRTREETEQFTETQKLITEKRKDIQLQNYLRLSEELQKPSVWEAFKTRFNQTAVTKLEKKWMHQAAHAHFTIDALFESDTLLERLLELTKKAQKEACNEKYLTRKGLNISAYKNYLITLEQHIKQEREAMTEALFYRLKLTFENHALNHCSPLRTVLDDLHRFEVRQFDSMRKNSEITRHEAPFPIAKAYAHLMTHASAPLKAQIRPYFLLKGVTAETDMTIRPLRHGKNYYLAPETLSGLIPAKWSFWMRLAPGYKARYDFMHDKANVLFQLLDTQHASFPKNNTLDLNHPYWHRLDDLQHRLDDELNQTEQKKYRWFSFLFKKANTLFSRWNNLVLQQQRVLMRKQVDYLEAMANNMTSPLSLLLQEQPGHYPAEHATGNGIQLKLERVEKRLDDLLFSDGERRRFQAIKQKIIRQWERKEHPGKREDRDSTLASKLHRLTNSSQAPSPAGYFALCTELQALKTHDEPRLQHLAIHQAYYFKVILAQMIEQLVRLPKKVNSGQSLSETSRYLMASSKLLSFVMPYADGMELSLQALKKQVQVFLNGYPEYIRNLSPAEAKAKKESLTVLRTALFSVLSLNASWNKEMSLLFQADRYLDAVEQGIKPVDEDKLLQKADALLVKGGNAKKETTKTPVTRDEVKKRELNNINKRLLRLGCPYIASPQKKSPDNVSDPSVFTSTL